MMRIILIEDEKPALARLERAIRQFDPAIEIIASFGSVSATVAWLAHHPQPDLMVCDIQLSDGLSLQIFQQVALSCPVIFCTAYDEYVMEALACSGIDYLLKPIDQERLHQALTKYLRLRSHFAGRIDSLTEALLAPAPGVHAGAGQGVAPAALPGIGRYRERVLVKKGIDFLSVPVGEIAYFTTEHKLVVLVARSGSQYVVDKPLGELADELDPRVFFRVNRQFLVHYPAVRRFRPHSKGRIALTLDPPVSGVVVSQENARRFREWMDR